MSSPLRTLGNHSVLLILSACLIQAQPQIEEELRLMCKVNCIVGLCEGGYLKRAEFYSGCKAFCQNGCLNGTCIGRNVCLCHGNFHLEGNTTSECLLVCGNWNECSCLEGYTKDTEICKCWEGYEETPEGCHLKTTTTTSTEESSPSYTTQLPTAAESVTSSADFLMLHHSNCSSDCLCWKELDEEGILSNSKCAKICSDDQDKPCRNLSLCSCHLPIAQMICIDSEEGDSFSKKTRYVCQVPKPKEDNVEIVTLSLAEKTSAPAWAILMASCAGVILLAVVAVLILKFYFRASRTAVEAI
ncbi:hypothetical protein KR009_010687 [Drosophila setifemur]|nr:hypothetical protein KR009_010687 [Drosophila setifemur]